MPEASLDDYLANVALYSDIQNNVDEDHVVMMTVHAAKGLEFKNVFVIGMSEGVFPAMKSVEEDGIKGLEEESEEEEDEEMNEIPDEEYDNYFM